MHFDSTNNNTVTVVISYGPSNNRAVTVEQFRHFPVV